MRWCNELACMACLLLVACAHEAGSPWGTLELDALVRFAPTPARQADEGRWRTALSYSVALHELSITVASITVRAAGDAGTTSFDPARPPPGYSLCHSGHCHSDDGRLVPYAEVAREVGAGSGAFALTLLGTNEPLDVLAGPTPAPLGACPDHCDVPRGELSWLEMRVGHITFAATVFDEQTGSPRLPTEGLQVTVCQDVNAIAAREIAVALERGELVGVRAEATLALTDRFLDGVDFGTLPANGSAEPVSLNDHVDLTEPLSDTSELDVSIDTFNP